MKMLVKEFSIKEKNFKNILTVNVINSENAIYRESVGAYKSYQMQRIFLDIIFKNTF